MNNNSPIIAICVAQIQVFPNTEICNLITHKAKETGMKPLVFNAFSDLYFNSLNDRGEDSVFDIINYNAISGCIILSETIKDKEVVKSIIKRCNDNHVPVVSIDNQFDNAFNVLYDYADGFEELVRHVVEYHHCKRVNFIAGMKDNEFSDTRLNCFKRVIEENGIPYDERRIGYGNFWNIPTYKVIDDFMQSGLEMPEAIICANDSMAVAACSRLYDYGYKVPRDVIVTGFDGIELARCNTPKITTAEQNLSAAAEAAVNIIDRCIKNELPPHNTIIPYRIEITESCGCKEVDAEINSKKIVDLYTQMTDRQYYENYMLEMLSSVSMHQHFDSITESLKEYIMNIPCHTFDLCICPSFYENPLKDATETIPPDEPLCRVISRFDHDISTFTQSFTIQQMLPDFERFFDYVDTLMFIPLHFHEKVYGFFAIGFKTTQFNYERIATLTQKLDQVLAINHSKLVLAEKNRRYEFLYIHDPMTGLYNRRGFYTHLNDIEKCSDGWIMVISIDLDNLKGINDNYGHGEGDFAIKAVADIISECGGTEAINARFGGDEFVAAILGDTPADVDINAYRNRFNELSKKANIQAGKPYSISASFGGYCVKLSEVDDFDTILRMSDELMYRNKAEKKMFRSCKR